jgi:hypothetical protein
MSEFAFKFIREYDITQYKFDDFDENFLMEENRFLCGFDIFVHAQIDPRRMTLLFLKDEVVDPAVSIRGVVYTLSDGVVERRFVIEEGGSPRVFDLAGLSAGQQVHILLSIQQKVGQLAGEIVGGREIKVRHSRD